MSKTIYSSKARNYNDGNKFTEITFEVDKILYFTKSSTTGNTIITLINEQDFEIETDYDTFKNTFYCEIFEKEIKEDMIKLMNGYLSNSSLGSISIDTMIKDCYKIVEKIGKYEFPNNTI